MENQSPSAIEKQSHARYLILALLFLMTSINYADRATLSFAGPAAAKDLGLSPASLGYIFSAFGWAYVAAQLPGGWLLDRYGSRTVYAFSILLWSFFTATQGLVGLLTGGIAITVFFMLRFLVGMAEAPAFPGNSRVVAAWFPASERGTASAVFNSAQYFATAAFSPLMGWITHSFGWPWVFGVMGGLGIILFVVWMKSVRSPKDHPLANRAEVDYIAAGGGLVDMDQPKAAEASSGPKWNYIKQLLTNRMTVGVFVAQYGVNAVTYFFLTWFPVYLVQARGMSILKAGFVASIPALCGFIGGVLGGILSDYLLRRGHSLTFARKSVIVLGFLMSTSMVACNYVDVEWMVVGFMALAFFGKGLGALGWAVMSDIAPKEIVGLSGGLFNLFGNIASIVTPIVIGYIVQDTGSFNGALVYVGANCALVIFCYLFVVGEIKRMELKRG